MTSAGSMAIVAGGASAVLVRSGVATACGAATDEANGVSDLIVMGAATAARIISEIPRFNFIQASCFAGMKMN
jgi:hypothetical protein